MRKSSRGGAKISTTSVSSGKILGDVGGDAPRLVACQQFGGGAPAVIILTIDEGECRPFVVAADKAGPRSLRRSTVRGSVAQSFRNDGRSDEETSLSLEPFADNAGTLLTIGGPCFRKHVVGNFLRLDAECIPDQLTRVVPVVTIDRSFEK